MYTNDWLTAAMMTASPLSTQGVYVDGFAFEAQLSLLRRVGNHFIHVRQLICSTEVIKSELDDTDLGLCA